MSDSVLATQDDPAGAFFVFDVDPAFADQSVTRCPAIIAMNNDGGNRRIVYARDCGEIAGDASGWDVPVASDLADGSFDQYVDGIFPITVDGRPGPMFLPGIMSAYSIERPPHVDSSEIMGGSPLPGNPVQYFSGSTYVTRTGNSLLVAVLWDPTGGITITSVKFGDDVELLQIGSTQTLGGSSGYKLAWYMAANLTKTNPLIALPLVGITFSGNVAEYQAALMEIRDGVAGGTDALVTAEGNDAFPTTPASSETGVSLECQIAVLALDSQITLQQVPAGDDGMATLASNTSPHLSLVVYKKNFIDLTNIGFATTLDQARGWAVATASFS